MKSNQQIIKKYLLLIIMMIALVPGIFAQGTKAELAKGKQTTLELYVTSAEAYEMWKANPEKVNILDVRTPEEYYYIGHAEAAWNIPIFFQSYEWDADKKHFPMTPNPDFMKDIKEVFQTDDIILITCRSGARSAMATNKLAETGYNNVYNITDGFEGDKVKDSNSVYKGYRMVNGWKNSGLPYSYSINPKQMLIEGTN